MRFLEKYKAFVVIGIILLLILVVVVGVRFFKEDDASPNIPKDSVVLPGEEDFEFINDSSLSVEEIWNLVNSKRADLRKLFFESDIYSISEIDAVNYTKEDDETYIVFHSSFLKKLNELVCDEIYYSIFSQMTLIKEQFYLAKRDIFTSIYLDSAISEVDVDTSELRLMMASDEYINASVTLTVCENQEDEKCDYVIQIPFELRNMNGVWKINKFQR